ncbi:uncharacterized protein LOC110238485 isoform X2 [Exaiptasia diaphana]|uniref:NB-ARC domain-containing protein n=1 Tax=Exaiptasia diaphana TaxID=2652724 RepID=A0A913X6Z1_EXADI|nr:uncharacterized protein LOC110238485 isoform X2 [Exaiptasia diaphana]
MEYSDEQLNFFRLCRIVVDIVPEGLRKIFKQEWDALYTTAHGQWDDTPVSYTSFYNMESPVKQKKNERLLEFMSSGDRKQWDCTRLFYAILYSDSVGPNIRPVVKTSVDDLREIRNEVVAHKKVGKLNDLEFKMSIQKIKVALSSLNLDTTKLKIIEKRADFITQEQIDKIKKELEDIKKKLENEKRRNTEPKSFCVLPPQPSHDTMERTKEVDDLFQAMQQLSTEKNRETTTVYLSGNPGSGKSVMARQVGEKYYDSDDSKEILRFVMTLNAATLDAILNSYVMFAERLNCYQDCITSITTSKDLSKEEQILQLRALADKQVTKYSSWLIIVDNVVDLKSFSQYWQQSGEKTSGKGQILVTTQDSPSISVSSYCHHISISSGMTENDAIELLCKVSDYRDDDNDDMLKVSRALDFQPLALSSTAVYMRSVRTVNKQYSWHQCLEQVEKERERLEKVYERTSLTYKTTMTAAVNLALQREMNDEIMFHVFRFVSVMAADPIPLMYVVEYVEKCLPDEDRNYVASRICSSSLVLSLSKDVKDISIHQVVYHCLQTNPKITERKVNMFTVISAFRPLPNMIEEEEKQVDNLITTRPLLNHLVKISKGIFDFVMNSIESEKGLNDETIIVLDNCSLVLYEHHVFERAQNLCQVLLALKLSNPPSSNAREILIVLKDDHIKYITTLNENAINPSVGDTLCRLGNVYANLGQLKESMKYYEKALTIKTVAYSENHPSVGNTLNNLGNVYDNLGQSQESIKYYEKALTIKTAAYGENHTSVGDTLNNLGSAYQKLGQLQESMKYYKKGLTIKTAAYGENHTSVGDTLNNLGSAYQKLGQLQESMKYYKKGLTIKTAAYGENHTSVGDTLNNVGTVYKELGQLQESMKYYEKALVIYTAAYGENHTSVGDTLNNVGNVYQGLGQLQESMKYYEKALIIYTAAYGENHTSVGNTLNNLGMVYKELGQLQESMKYYKKALTIKTAAYGENHPSVGDTLNNLGIAYQELGQLQESIKYYEKAMAIYTAAYGENHTSFKVGNTLNNLGMVYKELGQLQESMKYYKKALTIKTAAYGENHPSVGDTLNNLGIAYQELGQLQESIKYYEKAMAIYTAAYGENHTSFKVGNTLNNLGMVYKELGQLQESMKYYEKALTIKTAAYGENHTSVGNTLNNLGMVYQFLGQLQESIKYYEKALKIYTAACGENHISVGHILNNLGTLYQELGQLQESMKCYEKALTIYTAAYGENHPSVGNTLNNFGMVYRQLVQLQESMKY